MNELSRDLPKPPPMCAVPLCNTPLREGQLFCWPHWRKIPKELQQRVYMAYRNFKRCQNGRVLLAITKHYKNTRAEAVAAAQREGDKPK